MIPRSIMCCNQGRSVALGQDKGAKMGFYDVSASLIRLTQ